MSKSREDKWKDYKKFESELFDSLNEGDWGHIDWLHDDRSDFKNELMAAWERSQEPKVEKP